MAKEKKKDKKVHKKEHHMDMHEAKELHAKDKMPKKMMKACSRSR